MNFNKIIEQIAEYGLEGIRESVDIECKLAIGKDGKGGLPNAVWESYSAFANTDGGVIILGVKENTDGSFITYGIEKPAKIRTDFFNTINNKDQVSDNLLTDKSLMEMKIDNKTIMLIAVPRASRKQQPIYLKKNPLNSYIRQNEGDYRLDEQRVARLMADREHDSRDDEVLANFTLDDIYTNSLKAYRQRYTNLNPYSDINDFDDTEFLRHIGGYGTNRITKQSGLTKAGLLMFGKHSAITEVFPDYFVDYQEWGDDIEATRWLDRITPDGTWSGNLFDFYNKTILKLSENLKVPFVLKDGIRQEDTPVHKAVREALVNSIVHADYTDKSAILIIKKPTGFYFRNPGNMRMPIELARLRSETDCRNRKLQQMFRMLKICEQAGSGLPDIELSWRSQHWIPPNLTENFMPSNHTILQMDMVDLFPQNIMQELQAKYGQRFDSLDKHEQTILALATQGEIDHKQLKPLLPIHPADITKMLQHLVKQGMLVSTGGRWAIYSLANENSLAGNDQSLAGASTGLNELSYPNNEPSYPNNEPSYPNNEPSYPNNEPSYPNNEVEISDNTHLISIATPARLKKRLPNDELRAIILQLCQHDFLSLIKVSDLIARTTQTTQNHLTALVKEAKLAKKYPQDTHPSQAYRTTDKGLAYLQTLDDNPQQDLLI